MYTAARVDDHFGVVLPNGTVTGEFAKFYRAEDVAHDLNVENGYVTNKSRSAACGAWVDFDGRHAHQYCEGRVALPPPEDECQCFCHYQEA